MAGDPDDSAERITGMDEQGLVPRPGHGEPAPPGYGEPDRLQQSTTGAGQAPFPAGPAVGGSLGDVVTTAVLTATLVPFVQAIASKAGQDAYGSLRRLFRRLFARNRTDVHAAVSRLLPADKRREFKQAKRAWRAGARLKLVDRSSGTAVLLPAELPRSAARHLAGIGLSDPEVAGAELVWDGHQGCWVAYRRGLPWPLVWDGNTWRE